MIYGIISDIHSNLEALQAVIEHSKEQGVEEYFCLGDIVGYNSNPEETIDLLKNLNLNSIIKGNHDYYVSSDIYLNDFNPAASQAVQWTRRNLSDEKKKWLADLPMKIELEDLNIVLVHSSLDEPEAWNYVFDKFYAENNFAEQKQQICFIGHTHVPYVFELALDDEGVETYTNAGVCDNLKPFEKNKYLINVGSVGQSRDGNPQSSYVTFDSESREIVFHRVEYDVQTTQQKNIKAGLTDHLAFRLGIGR